MFRSGKEGDLKSILSIGYFNVQGSDQTIDCIEQKLEFIRKLMTLQTFQVKGMNQQYDCCSISKRGCITAGWK